MFTRYIFEQSNFISYILLLEYKYMFPLFLKWFIFIECIPVSLPTSFSPFLFFGKLLYRLSSREERNEVLLCFHSIYIKTVRSTFFVKEKEHFDNRVNDYMSILRPYSSQKQQQLHPSILVHYKNSFLIGLMNTCVFKHHSF